MAVELNNSTIPTAVVDLVENSALDSHDWLHLGMGLAPEDRPTKSQDVEGHAPRPSHRVRWATRKEPDISPA